MKTRIALQSSLLALMAVAGAAAHSMTVTGEGIEPVAPFVSTLSAADVRAEGVVAAHAHNLDPERKQEAHPLALGNNGLARATVRNEAVAAQRAGEISFGESAS